MATTANSKKQVRKIYQNRIYYFFLAGVLAVCLVQFLYSTLYNATRFFVLDKKLSNLEAIHTDAMNTNETLKTQLKVYSSHKGIEELARNNLKMVGQDEVLVLIKK